MRAQGVALKESVMAAWTYLVSQEPLVEGIGAKAQSILEGQVRSEGCQPFP